MPSIAVVPDSVPAEVTDPRAYTLRRFFEAIQAGDAATLEAVLTPDATTRWPQSGEQITGALSCIQVHASYPGGPPAARVDRVLGAGAVWIAELSVDYGAERWYLTSIAEFEGDRIARLTDWFGPQLPAPEWRRHLVDQTAPD